MARRNSFSAEDRALGMDRAIARRDVLHGAAGLLGAGMLGGAGAVSPEENYPPLRQGLRGSHPGSFDAAHALRDGALSDPAAAPAEAEDGPYDLAVVGAGISGLAAALFYQEARPGARVLLLDNHDDFGGHARRNEFRGDDGRLLLMNGGTMSIDSPRPFGGVADGLLRALGVRPEELEARCSDPGFYGRHGCGRGVFFDPETFGADHLATGVGQRPWAEVLRGAPLPETLRADIARLHEAEIDHLPGLSSDEKKARLARMSYRDYLLRVAGADPASLPFFQAMSHGEWGVGADAVGALDVWAFGFPGFRGLGLAPGAAPGMGYTAAGYAATRGSYRFHFPDGNASLARLLVRRLVPDAIPGDTAEDVVAARADYARLDRPGAEARIRLNSTVLSARNAGGAETSEGVEIAYSRGGRLRRVRAGRCEEHGAGERGAARNRRLAGPAAGQRSEVGVAQLHGHRPAERARSLAPSPDLVGEGLHPGLDLLNGAEVSRVGGFAARRLARPVRPYRPLVLRPRDGVEVRPRLTEVLLQEGERALFQIAACPDAEPLHLGRGRRADAVEP